MSKFIGDVSAYAYAVSKGYTGTEEEFAELMASYADVGQTAVDAKDAAIAAKTAAETASNTATNKASEATTAAQTATTKAGEASTSASTATSAKDTAVSASQVATSKASEAAQSATSANTAKAEALTAKTAAQAAQTAAETAQGKAETAQGAAEDAAESVSASAAQIATNTSDISDLKEDLTQLDSDLDAEVTRAEAEEARIEALFTQPVEEAVNDWLDAHPEATTTVQDNSITDAKLVQSGGILDTVRKVGQNKIFSDLYQHRYIGHKGFSGWINDSISPAVVQSNSLMALDLAKKMGIKFVETDTTVLSDGTWVISHDMDTGNMSGTLANLIDIDINDFKSRKVIREYLTNGAYWTYTAEEQYTPPTLEEYLLRAKDLGLYVLPEVKWSDNGYTAQNWATFGNTVRNCGMENNIVIYTAYTAYMRGMYEQLPNTPVCNSTVKASNIDELVVELSRYPFAFACTGETNYSYTLQKCIEANIPLGLWVIDDYDKAKDFIYDGGAFLVTDCLSEKFESNSMFLIHEYGMDEFYLRSANYKTSGSVSYDSADKILEHTTSTYNNSYLHNMPVSPQDVIEVQVKIKSDDNGEGQILISNGLASPQRRRISSTAKNNDWETVTAYYIAGASDTQLDIGITSKSKDESEVTVLYKDLVIKCYTLKDVGDWVELTNISYKTDGKSVTVTRKSNVSVPASTWTSVDTLPFPLRPTRTLEFSIGMGGTGGTAGLLKIDKYGLISIYCSSQQSVQYYTITFNV